MITTLRIKNLALVEDLTLELEPGFNAISGETGAGKSILIGALSLLLGERADRNSIRSGAESCVVEGVFHLEQKTLARQVNDWLEEQGLEKCDGAELLLRRSFTTTGTNKQFVNGSPVTLQVLSTLGEWLVDFHGPHDHQSLLQPLRQLLILDAYGRLQADREAFATVLRKRQQVEARKEALVVDEKTYAQQLDLLRHQVHEIRGARLKPGDDVALDEDYQRSSNAARILQIGQEAMAVLEGDDASITQGLGQLGRLLSDLQKQDAGAGAIAEQHALLTESLEEIRSHLGHYLDRVEVDPDRLRELEERVNLLHSLKRKYGSSIEAILAHGVEAAEKLADLEGREGALAEIEAEMKLIDQKLKSLGGELSKKRRKLLDPLSKAVMKQLSVLGFKQSHFQITLNSTEHLGVNGQDAAEFQFAPNVGEPPRPLRSIASSGEMARVMLAIKTVLAEEDEVPVLVFDEVDANVGGETARAVGEKMSEIGEKHQVLCITHLAPVAAAGRSHWVVRKEVKQGRTLSQITRLDEKQRVEELARMLGGKSEEVLKHAQSLLRK